MAVGKGSILRATNAADVSKPSVSTKEVHLNALLEIPLSQITSVPSAWFAYTHLKPQVGELSKSIKKLGLIEPIILRQMKEEQFQLLSGYKRLEAVKELGQETILARVLGEMTSKEAREIFEELHKNSNRDNIHEVKFQVISSIQSDMPEYLL